MSKHLTAIKGFVKKFFQHSSLNTKVNIEFGKDVDAGTVKEIRRVNADGEVSWDIGLG